MASLGGDSNDILAWVRAGFDPHPVVPPGVDLHPRTTLEAKNRGKAPGLMVEGTDLWKGVHWLLSPAERARQQRSEIWGASFRFGNGGCATGRLIVAIDIDCMIAELAAKLRDLALEVFGWSPIRIGRAPKCLLIYAAARDELEQPTRVFNWQKGSQKVGVEILGTGRQFVCKGVHPDTLMPYTWDCDPLETAEAGLLATATTAKVRTFIDIAKRLMSTEGFDLVATTSTGGRRSAGVEAPPAESLLAHDMSVLASAVAAIPNEPDTPREDYIALGYAIKAAAGPDREGEAFLIWYDWAEKWEPGDEARANTMERCEADWARLKPPYFIGADYVYSVAAEHGWSKAPVIQHAFAADPLPDVLPGTDDAPLPEAPPPPRRELSPDEQVLAADFGSDMTVLDAFDEAKGHDLLYATDRKEWRIYEEGIWRPLPDEEVKARLVDFLRVYAPRYFPPGDAKNDAARIALTSSNRIGGFARLAPAMVGRRVKLAEIGQRTDILVTPAGVIELRPGLPTRAARPDDYSLARTAVAPAPKGSPPPALFLETLGFASAGVKGAQKYVQLALGNMLLGNPAQIVLIFWGRGGNGKSTLLEVIKAALGVGTTGYATASVLEMWQRSIDFALVHLAGKRAAVAAEFSPDAGWNDSLVKAISGGDTLLSRDLHQSYGEQRSACMPMFAFNEPPVMKRINEAMIRRLAVIAGGLLPGAPAGSATIIHKDVAAKQRIIETELPAVLRWMLDGAERVLAGETPLDRPQDVMRGMEMLIGEQDRIMGWIASNFVRTKASTDTVPLQECVEILKAQITRDEDEETQRRLLPHIDSRQFAARARAAGYETTRSTGGVTVFRGVRLRWRLTEDQIADDGKVLPFAAAKRATRVDWSG